MRYHCNRVDEAAKNYPFKLISLRVTRWGKSRDCRTVESEEKQTRAGEEQKSEQAVKDFNERLHSSQKTALNLAEKTVVKNLM